jgi:hypothetical protein
MQISANLSRFGLASSTAQEAQGSRQRDPVVQQPNERWSIDFMHDRLANVRTIRTMNVIDDFTRECLAIAVAFSFGSHDVIRNFEEIAAERGFPETIRFDNGSGMIGISEAVYNALGGNALQSFFEFNNKYDCWTARGLTWEKLDALEDGKSYHEKALSIGLALGGVALAGLATYAVSKATETSPEPPIEPSRTYAD